MVGILDTPCPNDGNIHQLNLPVKVDSSPLALTQCRQQRLWDRKSGTTEEKKNRMKMNDSKKKKKDKAVH